MTGAGIRDRQTAGMRLTERNREFIPAKKVQRTSIERNEDDEARMMYVNE